MITKPNNLLNNGELDQKYSYFQDKTKEIFNEAEEDLYNESVSKNKKSLFSENG